jgi:hypothetical protein
MDNCLLLDALVVLFGVIVLLLTRRRTAPAPRAPRYSAGSSSAALHAALVEADVEIEALHQRLGALHMDLEATTSCTMQLAAISERYKLACALGGVPVELMQKCLGDLAGGGQ